MSLFHQWTAPMNWEGAFDKLKHGVSLILRVAQPGDQIDYQRSMQSGIRFHLVKPVDPTVLEHALQKCGGR